MAYIGQEVTGAQQGWNRDYETTICTKNSFFLRLFM